MRFGASILSIFLLITTLSVSALGANIAVTDGEVEILQNFSCSLPEAIQNANNDALTNADCVAGAGPDTIILPNNSTFTLPNAPTAFDADGNNGLPSITTDITINGNGSTIERDSNLVCNINTTNEADEFRIFHVGNTGDLTLNNLTIQNGCADSLNGPDFFGGGIANFDGMLTINGSRVRDNSSRGGGGIYNDGTTTINNSTVSNNTSTSFGGGIQNEENLTLTNSAISSNTATDGGGINNGFFGTTTIENSTISANSATNDGGGLVNDFDGTVTIESSTISANSAANIGGGIFNVNVLNIKNTLVASNPSGGDCVSFRPFNAVGVNFDTDGTCLGFTQVTPAQLNLGPLADNNGPTQTHALLPGSVAIDAVIDCTDFAGANPINNDQRDRTRAFPAGGLCDVGAFEFSYEILNDDFRTTTGFNIPVWCGERKDEFSMNGVDFTNVEQYDTQIEIVLPEKRILGLFTTTPTTANIIEMFTITKPSNFQTPGPMTLPVRAELRSGKTLRFDCEDILTLPTSTDGNGDIDQLLNELLMDVERFHGVLTIETANRDLRVFVTKLVRSSKGVDEGGGLNFVESQLDKERVEIESFRVSNSQTDVFALGLQKLNITQRELGDHAIEFRAQSLNTQEMSVEIYGLNGQRVYSATSPSNSLVWRMQNNSGRPVANGVYLYIVSALDEQGNIVRSGVKKLLVMR